MQPKGSLFVVSAPSGTGKTTLVEALVPQVPGLEMSRSYTSRPPRPRERDGVEYNFVSRERFGAMRDAGEFLEWADVFGHLYGTSAIDTRRHRDAGQDLVLVIDVQGASQVRRLYGETVGIFVLPPSPAVLERRLRRRSRDHLTEEELRRRLAVAQREVERMADYDYVVVNDEVEECVERLRCIVMAERTSWRAAGAAGEDIARAFRNID
ncbi:MAG TPA: guanylate kinase [Vicinamibacterales bacterium]|nr:guanylate kinase [Vicinamibacterales bacterium]HJN44837.1 guanylate kinase [Vicinamibacterales bacterium]